MWPPGDMKAKNRKNSVVRYVRTVVLVALFFSFRDMLFPILQTNPTGSSGLGWLDMTCLQNGQYTRRSAQ